VCWLAQAFFKKIQQLITQGVVAGCGDILRYGKKERKGKKHREEVVLESQGRKQARDTS